MKKGAIAEFWDGIPVPVKLGAAAIIVLVAVKKIKNSSADAKAIREAKLQAELNKIYGAAGLPPPSPGTAPGAPTAQALSFPREQYKTWADTIHSYMDGAGTSSEEEFAPIFGKLKTNDDLNQLIKAFGSRWIASGAPWPFNGAYYTLAPGLRSELDIQYINDINNALDLNGITISI